MLSTEEIISPKIVTCDGQRIACDHYRAGHEKAIVIAHGFFNSKDAVLIQRMKECLLVSYDVICFDFRGHGKSSGRFTWTSREPEDLKQVLGYAGKNYARIGLIGFSYGAAISIIALSGETHVKSFIAVSAPYDSMKIDFRFWNLDVGNDIVYNLGEGGRNKGVRPGAFWLKKERPLCVVQKISCPVLYVHGEKDWVIRPGHSVKLYEKTSATKKLALIKGGSHGEYLLRPATRQETEGLMLEWLKETL